ncbi:MAG: isoprenyl transferase [Elusimicrobiota bacterium]|nr:isoprenyl transferase [Endomicrobiia bacterium]MDW8164951.1 isoprenyl transferase [Elusimicrobiota bacterium]
MKFLGIELDEDKIPRHVGIIMDGNGRWAQKRGLPRIFGHKAGAKTVKLITETSVKLGIKCLSLFAFSTENWQRPKDEIKNLFKLLRNYIKKEENNLLKNNIKVLISGDISKLDEVTRNMLKKLEEKLKNNTGLILNLCINYSGRSEIINAVNKILNSGIKKIDEEKFEKFLYTKDLPELDFLIRTSGELRISNFMLWQLAYTELYFTKTLWPDFTPEEFVLAIKDFQNRERRFGRIPE